jgi:acetyltransferase-like isoleucine patch superfamily enzyme
MLEKFILKIKRRETPFYSFLYRAARGCLDFSVPSLKAIHLPLYHLDRFFRAGLKHFRNKFWYAPLFKARCEKAGKHLSLPDGLPLVIGNHLRLFLGDNVTIRRSTIGSGSTIDRPELRIGSNTTIGYLTSISVAREIVIGENCLISFNCMIMDSDDHPLDPVKRGRRNGVSEEEIKPVRIGDNVWIGAYSAVLKGVTIGNNAVIGTHSVVLKDVPENSVVGSPPARILRNHWRKEAAADAEAFSSPSESVRRMAS